MRNILVGSFWMTQFLALFKLTHRPGSNLTGHFGLTSVCARHTTLTLTGTKWISIYLKLKKLKLRLLSSWGYVSLYYMVFKQTAHRQMWFLNTWKAVYRKLQLDNSLSFLSDQSKSCHSKKWRAPDCCYSGLPDRSVQWCVVANCRCFCMIRVSRFSKASYVDV